MSCETGQFHAHRRIKMKQVVHIEADIPEDRKLEITLPDDFPPGKAEITISVAPKKRRSTAQDLLNSEIFGMWADRTDITDSTEFARELRRKAWTRAKG